MLTHTATCLSGVDAGDLARAQEATATWLQRVATPGRRATLKKPARTNRAPLEISSTHHDVTSRYTVGLCAVCTRPSCERTDCEWAPWIGETVSYEVALADMKRRAEARYVDSESPERERAYAWRDGQLWYWADDAEPELNVNSDEHNAGMRWTRVDVPPRSAPAAPDAAENSRTSRPNSTLPKLAALGDALGEVAYMETGHEGIENIDPLPWLSLWERAAFVWGLIDAERRFTREEAGVIIAAYQAAIVERHRTIAGAEARNRLEQAGRELKAEGFGYFDEPEEVVPTAVHQDVTSGDTVDIHDLTDVLVAVGKHAARCVWAEVHDNGGAVPSVPTALSWDMLAGGIGLAIAGDLAQDDSQRANMITAAERAIFEGAYQAELARLARCGA